MYDQPADKSSEGKSELLEKIDKWLLEYDIKELKNSLNEIVENIKERVGISKIEGSYTSISLYCCNRDNGRMWCKYDSKIEIYNKGKKISCEPNIPFLPDKLECINYRDKSLFEISNLRDKLSYIEGKILDIHKTAYPGVLMNLGNQSITISIDTYIDSKQETKKANSKIIKDNNSLIYEKDGFYIRIYWHTDEPCKS
ncbi:Uncharacterized protein Nst1_147 [Candidatus Nanobsidianus stetteri]|uniref:Uncharacterized protein n=1 Tax=Nanobsidianus stetteri TaxID=1294122 RepID=R1E537_NANST|nr:Uncharacterized protein Nst1_147 [Candidatus Nanobsidianus stetteri]